MNITLCYKDGSFNLKSDLVESNKKLIKLIKKELSTQLFINKYKDIIVLNLKNNALFKNTLNIDFFIEYVWFHKKELKKFNKKAMAFYLDKSNNQYKNITMLELLEIIKNDIRDIFNKCNTELIIKNIEYS